MCEIPGLDFIPSPLDVVRSVGSLVGAVSPRGMAAVAGSVVVVAFTAVHALAVGLGVGAFLVAMGAVLVLMRRPDYLPAPEQAVPVLPRNLAITQGQRAIEAPKVVLSGQVLEAAERVAR